MPQITINTGMDTKPVWNGIKDMNSALRSLRSYVSRAGKEMNASVVGYAKAMQANADASREVDERVRELNEAYSELLRQINELGDAKIDTTEYANLKKEIEGAEKELQRLQETQQRMRDLGKDAVPTKEYANVIKSIDGAKQKAQKLKDEYIKYLSDNDNAVDKYNATYEKLTKEQAQYDKYEQERARAPKADKAMYTVLMDDSAKKIEEYKNELQSAEIEVNKYDKLMSRIEERINEQRDAYNKAIAKKKELESTGGDILETEAMQRNQYDIQKTTERLRDLQQQKKEMERDGSAFIYGDETEEWDNLAKTINKNREEWKAIRDNAMQDTHPLHIQEWEQMATITGAVSEGFSRVLYAAQMAGHAITHPIEALNRLIPVVLSGLGQLAQKALDVAMSFARWAINNIVNGVKRLASAALNAAAGLARMVGSAVVSFLQRLANAAKNAAVQLARVAGKAVITGLKGIGSLAAQAGKAILGIGKSAKKSNNGLGQAVKMLVRYGFGVRSVFMLVRRLRSALVDAFKNMAKQVPEVNKAISSLSASLGMLKNSMATAFQPILNAIAPILTQFMDMLSEAMTKVGMFFAALVGQDYVYKATKAQFDYAKSLDKTKKSAKEAENQLASFDELNILKAPNDSSSGTGTDTNAADAGKFVKTPLESGIKEFVDTLKRMFQSGEFDEIGKLLADKFNKFISLIDWDGYAVKIGNLVNGLVEFYNAFMENTNWQNIGQTIADVINGLVDTIDWEALGRAFSQKINAIFGILAGLVDRINAANLGVAISNALWGFVGNIKWEEIGSTIGNGITKIADTIIYFATNFKWEDFATEVANGANALFSKITPSSVGGALVGIINGGFKFLLRFLRIFKFEEHGQALQEGIRTFVDGVNTDTIGEALKTAILGILSYVTPAIEDEETWNLAGVKLAGMLNKLFGVDQDGETIWTKLSKAIDGLIGGVISGLTGFVSTFEWGENGEKFRQGVLKLIENFPAGPLGHLINISIKGVLDGMGPTISDPKVWSELGTKLGTALNEMLGDKETWQKAGEAANGMMNGILTFGENFLTTFDETTAADNIKAALDEIKWGEIATKLWNTAKLAFQKAGSFMDVLFSESMDNTRAQIDPAYVEKITAFNSQSLGAKIGSRIREAFTKIPWSSIASEMLSAAKKAFGEIGDFLVSLFSTDTSDLNAVVSSENKFEAVGKTLSEAISKGLEKVDWPSIGDVFNTLFTGGLDFLIGFVEKFDADSFTDGMCAALERVEWGTIAAKLAELLLLSIGKIGDVFQDAILNAFGFKDEDQKLQMKIEQAAAQLIASGATASYDEAMKWAREMYNVTEDTMDTMTNTLFTTYIQDIIDQQGNAEEATLQAFDVIWSAIDAEGNGELIASDWMYSIIGELDTLEAENEEQFVAIVTRMFGSVDAYNAAKSDGKEFMWGIVNGMSGEEGETKDKLVGIIDRVLGYVESSPEGFDIHSPSKRSAGYGENFMKGFVKGVTDEESDTKNDTVGVFDNIFGGIVASAAALALLNIAVSLAMDSMSTKMSTTLNSISSNFSTTWQAIGTTVTTAVSNIVSDVPRMFAEMGHNIADQGWWSVGDYIVAGIQSGVQDNWRWLERTVWNLAISLYNTACNALGIHSPSKLFREGVGQMIGLGVAEGFEDTEPTIMNSVTDVADAMVDKMARTDMQFDVGTETALSSFSDKIADSFATLLDRLQAIADSVTFRTPAVAAGTVVPYNVAASVGGDSTGLVEALEVSNDDLASVIIQATNNAAVAIVDAIQRHGGINNPNVSAQTSAIIDEINRRTRANGVSPILM